VKKTSGITTEELLKPLVICRDISTMNPDQLLSVFTNNQKIHNFAPSGKWSRDPRTGEAVLFNPARSERPVDYPGQETPPEDKIETSQGCPVCRGETTAIIDEKPLSLGNTVINMNLFPMLLPDTDTTGKTAIRGLHLLQWTSTRHSIDWPELSDKDQNTVMKRLAVLEAALYSTAPKLYRYRKNPPEKEAFPQWYVSIIKNSGRAVGGSLEHGHQQITLTDCLPGSLLADISFQEKEGIPFSAWLHRTAGKKLQVSDYGSAVLVVPPFMKRPFDMILLLTNPETGLLKNTDAEELKALAHGWSDAISLMRSVLLSRDREAAYNVVMRTNPLGGLYVEFLPYSQEYGGYERTGLFSCQSDPEAAAGELRERLSEINSEGPTDGR